MIGAYPIVRYTSIASPRLIYPWLVAEISSPDEGRTKLQLTWLRKRRKKPGLPVPSYNNGTRTRRTLRTAGRHIAFGLVSQI